MYSGHPNNAIHPAEVQLIENVDENLKLTTNKKIHIFFIIVGNYVGKE